MDTASHPAQRGTERYRRRVKRVGRRTLGRGVTGEEERRRGGGAGDYKRRKIYNPRMKFIRTSHLPLSTLRKLQRASSYSFLSFSLSLSSIYASLVPRPIDTTLPLSLSLSLSFCALLSDNRKGRGADGANKRYPAPFVIELLVLPLDVLLKTTTSREMENRRGCTDTDRITSTVMKHRSRGFRKWVREEDGYAVKAHYCSSCLITIPFPLEIAAWRKGDRADLAVEQSVPTHPSSIRPFSCLAMDGWRRYHSRGASR